MAFILSLRHALALYDVGIRQMESNNKKKHSAEKVCVKNVQAIVPNYLFTSCF